jgi:hypothetical protein
VNVVVQFDRSTRVRAIQERSPIRHDVERSFLRSPHKVEPSVENVGSTKQARLRNFICETMRRYEADHYMLVVSGHCKAPSGDSSKAQARPRFLD